jgi:phosphonoacetaldehyde hydrolase
MSDLSLTIGAVILDWAGTIVDHGSRAPVVALREAFASAGLELDETQARGPMGLGKRDHIAALLQLPALREGWTAAHGSAPDEAVLDQLYAAFAQRLPAAVAAHADVIPGVVEAVDELRARGMRFGSTTGYNRDVALSVASAAQRQGLTLESLVSTDDVRAGRPAPWMALRNLELLDVYPPSRVVKVGDTAADMQEGRNAGMWCVAVTETGNELGLSVDSLEALTGSQREALAAAAAVRLRDAGAHETVPSVAQLASAISAIEVRLGDRERP